jgi:dTDP-4-amino-4,6-dideoxygalactose transaminase
MNIKKQSFERIEFGELRVGDTARQHLMDCCDTNWVSGGPKVKEFEERWADLFGYKKTVAMSSGTDGVINACLTLYELKNAVRNKSEVIVPALSFIATSNGVRAAGLVPKFVDVKCETLNIDEDLIEDAVGPNTVAIMPVHTMGKMANMDAICRIANKHELIVIEDACESHGASFNNGITHEYVGLWGHMAVFSHYIAHILACGEGGNVSTNFENIAELLSSTRSHGRPFNSIYFDHERTGINSKMNDLEASIGLEGIDIFWETFNKRHEFMRQMRQAAVGFEDVAWFSEEANGNINCPHGFSITCKRERDIIKVKDTFDKYNIHYKRNFGCIPTQHRAFADMGHQLGEFPNSEWIGNNGVHIGCHQYLTEENLERVCIAIQEGLS